MNDWESFYFKEHDNQRIFCIWCENRRLFYFNPNSTQQPQSQQLMSPNPSACAFNSKSFNLNFVPTGLLSFLTISSDGSIEIFIENHEASVFTSTLISDPNRTKVTNISDAFACQRANGKIFIFLQSTELISVYELSNENPGNPDGFNLQLISQCHLTVPSKFIWSESKELLIQIETISENSLKMNFFNYQNFSLVSSKTLEIPDFLIGGIFHSSRAANYIFINSKGVAEYVMILNLNGEIVKKLKIEFSDLPFDPIFERFNDYFEHFVVSQVIISPNGLLAAKVEIPPINAMEKPLLSHFPIGEIQPKSKADNYYCVRL